MAPPMASQRTSKRKPPARRARATPRRGPGRRLHGALLRKLGVAIVRGRYPPGNVLPDEIAFAEQLQVSRGAYREALQALTSKGLVERKPKAGTRVLPRKRWNLLDPQVLSWFFIARPDLPFIRNLFELRGIIEPAAARLAAQRRDDGDLAKLRAALASVCWRMPASAARIFARSPSSRRCAASRAAAGSMMARSSNRLRMKGRSGLAMKNHESTSGSSRFQRLRGNTRVPAFGLRSTRPLDVSACRASR